jgi:transcriptional regulator with XRE-family HTH domain
MNERSEIISRLIRRRSSREAYIAAKLKVLIPSQIRALRLRSKTPRQEDLASAADMKQSRISAMETPGAVNFNLDTLVRVASALKVGLVVKFVSFGEMLKWENEFNQDEFNPLPIDDDEWFTGQEMPPSTVQKQGPEYFQVGGFTEEFKKELWSSSQGQCCMGETRLLGNQAYRMDPYLGEGKYDVEEPVAFA